MKEKTLVKFYYYFEQNTENIKRTNKNLKKSDNFKKPKHQNLTRIDSYRI